MAYDGRSNRMRRKEAVGMQELVKEFIKEMKLSSGVNGRRVNEAWNVVSGASRYTLSVNFDRGVLYCTISSSVVRNQLYFKREALIRSLNEHLQNDALFVREWDGPIVRNLILR